MTEPRGMRWVPGRATAPEGTYWERLVDENGKLLAGVMRFYKDDSAYAFTATERSGAMESDEAAREWCVRKLGSYPQDK